MSETIEIESISRLDVKPGETLVFRLPYRLTHEQAADVKQRLQPHLPEGVKLLVVGLDVELTVVASASEWQPVPERYRA